MTPSLLILTTIIVVASCSSDRGTGRGPNQVDAVIEAPPPAEISFEADVLPILSEGCRPCHFDGGKMYEKLPFDRSDTIRNLGARLFTRIRDQQERAVVRAFLADGK